MAHQTILFHVKDRSLTHYRHFYIMDNHSYSSLSHYGQIPHYFDHFHNTKKLLISITSSHIHHFFTSHCFKVNNFLIIYYPILTKRTHSH